MKLPGGQTSCQHQRVAFDCCIRGYGLITHFIGTHGNRKYVNLCKHHQERHKQCCATGLRGMWICSCQILKSRPSTQKDQTSWWVTPEMIQRQQGLFGLTHPLDDESTSRPNGSSQTSELKASDSIYCFRYPRSGVPLWSIYIGLFQSKFSKTQRLHPQLCSGCSWPHPLSRKTMALFTLLSLEASDPLYLVLSPSSWERFHVMMPSQLKSEFTIAEIFHHIIES